MNDYFSALLRAAGTPLRTRAADHMAAPRAADVAPGDVFDPFDAVPDSSALPVHDEGQAAQAAVPASPHATEPARLRDQPSADLPALGGPASALAPPASLPALGRHAPPSVQAALRWVAAGVAHAPSGAAAADNVLPDLQPSARNATTTAPSQANDATARSVADAPRAARAAGVVHTDASISPTARPISVQPQHSANAIDGGPHQHRPMPTANAAQQRQAGAATAAPAQVHIGTLHVTLDAAATARFAAKPAATTPADPSPRAARGHDTRHAAHGGANGISGLSASALSRSRLPRF